MCVVGADAAAVAAVAAAVAADADAKARQEQLPEVLRHTAHGRHAAPHGKRQRDQVAPVPAIGEQRNRHAQRGIEERESRACEETQYRVADAEFGFYGRQQDREYLPVDEVERVDHDQQAERVAPRCGGDRHLSDAGHDDRGAGVTRS